MKLMVCGKGGVGKTVLTILAAEALSEKYKVYIVDSDESNLLLPRLLGVNPPKPLVEYVGGKAEEEEFEKREVDITKALAGARAGIRLSLLPTEYVSYSTEGIGLVVIGKVGEYGEGCACPFNILARILLKNLVLNRDEFVLVDTDAGVEHVGRKVEEAVDGILAVVDPTAESLRTARLLRDVALKLGRRFWTVANKVTPKILPLLTREAEKLSLKIDGAVEFDEEVYTSTLLGEKLRWSTALEDVRKLLEAMKLM